MYTINSIALSRLKAARHVAFHTLVHTQINNAGTKALGLDEAEVTPYKQAIDVEQDWVNVAYGSEYTARMEQLDAERKAVAQDILYRLTYSKYSPTAGVSEAFEANKSQILNRYKGIAALDYSARSGTIDGLLVDLEKLDEDVLKALGIDALKQQLTRANESFVQCFLSRNAQRAGLVSTLAEARKATDAIYAELFASVVGLANLSDAYLESVSDATTKEKMQANRTLTRRFIDELNEIISYFTAQYLKYGTKKAGASEDPAADGDAWPDGDEGAAGDDGGDDGSGSGSGSGAGTGPTDVTEVFD